MPWLPLYIDEADARELRESLDSDPDVAFIVSDGVHKWIAVKALESAADGRYCLWHVPSGPLPLVRAASMSPGSVDDPWAGWTELQGGADATTPYFGAGHPGIVWWNLRTQSVRTRGIGMSSFEWIGNRYRMIGSPAHPSTEAWWKRLRALVKRHKARRIPRTGPADGPGPEIWAMPSALTRIESGVPRDANPW